MDDAFHTADSMIREVHAVSVASRFSLDAKHGGLVRFKRHGRGTTEKAE